VYKYLPALLVAALSIGAVNGLIADEGQALSDRITRQLNVAGRDKYDAVKDATRKPVEVARFFGIRRGMTVLDMGTGGGYNAEILSAAVGPEGIVYAQNSHYVLRLLNGAHHNTMIARLAEKRLPNVRYIVVDAEDMPFRESIDLVFWGFNIHDVYNEGGEAATLNDLHAMGLALKPGGIIAVSDHVGVAGNDNKELHRIETATIVDMLGKAGFVVEQSSDLLANPDDDHSLSIYTDGLRYQTDRVLIRGRKPK
jgi:predicted methyltransferase